MLSRVAQGLSSFFICRGIIKNDDREVYDYCFEILLSTVLNSLIILILSLLSSTFVNTFWFLLGFLMIRMTSGGFHAKTHLNCMLLLVAVYLGYLFLLDLILKYDYIRIAISLGIFSWACVILFSPVEDANKPLDRKEINKYRILSNIIIVIVFVIASVLAICFEKDSWCVSCVMGVSVGVMSLIAGKIKNSIMKKGRETNEKE